MDKTLAFNHHHLTITLSSDADESVFNEIFIEREYSLLDEIIQKAKNPVIDIGAHIGLFSIYARTLNAKVPILAYEPAPDNFTALKKNLKQNHVENIITKNVAVTSEKNRLRSKEGQVTLYLSSDSHNHSTTRPQPPTATQTTTQPQLAVPSTTLDRILRDQPAADLIKIDAEGAEFEILANTTPETFSKIKAFYIEYHELTPEMSHKSLIEILKSNGFSVHTTPSHYDKRMGFILAISIGHGPKLG